MTTRGTATAGPIVEPRFFFGGAETGVVEAGTEVAMLEVEVMRVEVPPPLLGMTEVTTMVLGLLEISELLLLLRLLGVLALEVSSVMDRSVGVAVVEGEAELVGGEDEVGVDVDVC